MDGKKMPWGVPLPPGVMSRLLSVAYELRRSGRFYGNPEDVVEFGAHYGFKVDGRTLQIYVHPTEELKRELDLRWRVLRKKLSETVQAIPAAIKDFPKSEQTVLMTKKEEGEYMAGEIKYQMEQLQKQIDGLESPYMIPVDLEPLLAEKIPVALMPAFPTEAQYAGQVKEEVMKIEWQPTNTNPIPEKSSNETFPCPPEAPESSSRASKPTGASYRASRPAQARTTPSSKKTKGS